MKLKIYWDEVVVGYQRLSSSCPHEANGASLDTLQAAFLLRISRSHMIGWVSSVANRIVISEA